MWIKICGNTRLEDVQEAHRAGADAVGFIFAHGRRLVTEAQVRAITEAVPPSLETFGVFTQADPAYILRTAEAAGVTGIQFHGDFDLNLLRALRPHTRRIVQVVPWWVDRPAQAQAEEFRKSAESVAASGLADALLVDARTEAASGGTGLAIDWQAAARALEGIVLPVILAGGLRADTVATAIATMRPWGVDVSSGVEQSPGVKDHALLAKFMAAAK